MSEGFNPFEKTSVLDHGFVVLRDLMGGDPAVVRAARVSYDQDDVTGQDPERDANLIRYLMRNHHTSPFEHVVFKFEVQAPLLVFRQWMRHRTWSYNEVSARYAPLDMGFYVPELAQITTQSADSKQSRTMEQHPYAEQFQRMMINQNQQALEVYQEMLKAGCPRELARSVLPVSAYSRLIATVDLHNLFHFLRLRLHKHAQWEIQQYARALMAIVNQTVPVSAEAFKETLGEGY